jgi:hypothetical protein
MGLPAAVIGARVVVGAVQAAVEIGLTRVACSRSADRAAGDMGLDSCARMAVVGHTLRLTEVSSEGHWQGFVEHGMRYRDFGDCIRLLELLGTIGKVPLDES